MIKKLIELYISGKLHKGKRHVVRLLLKVFPYKNVRSYYGPLMYSDPKDITNVYAISGNYGHVIYDHIKSLPNNSVFIDIGANYGLYSLVAASHLNEGTVFAFEPNPAIYPYFLDNQKTNKAKNIASLQAAIGEQDGEATLSYNPDHSGISHIVMNKADPNSYKVAMCNIAKYQPIIEAAVDKEIHIKIDVEGFEMNIIKVLQKAPWYKQVKSLIVEVDDGNLQKFGFSVENLYTALEKDGFQAIIPQTIERQYDGIFIKP